MSLEWVGRARGSPDRLGHSGPSELWKALGFSLRSKKSYDRVLRREGTGLICHFNTQPMATMESRTIRAGVEKRLEMRSGLCPSEQSLGRYPFCTDLYLTL